MRAAPATKFVYAFIRHMYFVRGTVTFNGAAPDKAHRAEADRMIQGIVSGLEIENIGRCGDASAYVGDVGAASERGVERTREVRCAAVGNARLHAEDARRAAEELAFLYEHLPLREADLVASFRFGRKTIAALASEHGVPRATMEGRLREATFALEQRRRAS